MRATLRTQRLPQSGNVALAAAALIQLSLGIEFVLAGLNKLLDADLSRQFQAFVAAQPGSSSGLFAPLVQSVVLPHAAVAAYLAALTEFVAGAVLSISTLEVWRRRFSGRLGSQHGYEPVVALLSAVAALGVAGLSGMIYVLQGGGLPMIGNAEAFDSPIAIELFLVPVGLGIAWLEFGRFLALRTPRRGSARSALYPILVSLLFLSVACSSAAPAAGSSTTITMSSANVFQPRTLTVQQGATVTWVNSSSVTHTVMDDPTRVIASPDAALPSGAASFDSGLLAPGQRFSHSFDVPGEYRYVCLPHEAAGMVGTIVVVPTS